MDSDLIQSFTNELKAWASELPDAARLELDDAGRKVEMRGVSREKRHELKLLAQGAGIENAQAIESLLYLWLYQNIRDPGNEGESGYFHGRRSNRIVYRGNSKFEGSQIVGYFYPLREALLDYCNKSQGEYQAPRSEPRNFREPALHSAESGATASPAQIVTPEKERPRPRGLAEEKPIRPSRERNQVAKARAETVAKLIEELNILKPQMLEDESEYSLLHGKYPGYLTFLIAQDRPDLKMKIMYIRGSVRHIRLAQELAAAHYGLSRPTIVDAWKSHKPAKYKRA